MKPFFQACISRRRLPLLIFCTIAVAGVLSQGRADPRPPRIIEHIGNFFYSIANKIERSDIPERPAYDRVRANSSRARQRDQLKKQKPAVNYDSQDYIEPVNPDPMLLRPRTTAPSKLPDVTTSPANSGPTPPLPKTTVPLPDSSSAKKNLDKPELTKSKTDGRGATAEDFGKSGYPMAIPTNRMGRVKSPFPPNTELDVTGLPPGSLAKDPVTGKVFRLH